MITDIYLHLNDDLVEDNETDNNILDLESYYIVAYFARLIKKQRIKCEQARHLFIYTDSEKNDCYLDEDAKVVVVNLTNSYLQQNSFDIVKRRQFFFQLFLDAASAIHTVFPELAVAIDDIIEAINVQRFQNIWYHKKKRIAGFGNLNLRCELTATEFTLSLEVDIPGKDSNFVQTILKTRPNPHNYHHVFNELIVVDSQIKILDRIHKEAIYEADLKKLEKGVKGKLVTRDADFTGIELTGAGAELLESLGINQESEPMTLLDESGEYLVTDSSDEKLLADKRTAWWPVFKRRLS